MATGDQNDIQSRLQALIPSGWFQQNLVPIRDAILLGMANALAYVYKLLAYIRLQTRIATATDAFLDLIAGDFLGATLVRKANESDSSLRARILAAIIRERATRKGLISVLVSLTGRAPIIIELLRPADTGVYGQLNGYGQAGHYGSMLLPYQSFVVAYRPLGSGLPNVNGYGMPAGGYSQASQAEWADISMVSGYLADADIYAAIDSVKPAATEIWTRLSS